MFQDSLNIGRTFLRSEITEDTTPLSGAQATRLAHAQIRELFRTAGHGSITKLEKALVYSPGSIYQWRKRRNLDFTKLVDILNELRCQPLSFFAQLFSSSPHQDDLLHHPDVPSLIDVCTKADELRYTDPVAGLGLLSDAHHLSQSAPAIYAASAGSLFRVLQMSNEAGHFLRTALLLASDPYTRASTYRRLVPFELYCRQNTGEALQYAASSISLFQSVGAHHDARDTTIDSALAHYERGDFEEALSIAADLCRWSECPIRTKMSALQITGLISLRDEGQQAAGLNYLSQILELAPDTLSRGQTYYWLALHSKNRRRAIKYFDDAVQCFGSTYGYQTITCLITKVSHLGLCPKREFLPLLSLDFRCPFLNDFAQELASAAVLDRLALSRVQSRFDKAWTAQRAAQGHQTASKLLATYCPCGDMIMPNP